MAAAVMNLLALLCLTASLPALDFRQSDKQSHALGGALVGYISSDIADYFGAGPLARFFIGSAAGTAAGWLKELYDRHSHGTYDPNDAHATTIGAMGGATVHGGVSLIFTRDAVGVGYLARF